MVRAQQWVKNLFLLIPPFFAGVLFDLNLLPKLFLGIISFSLVASSIYMINDIRDIEEDRLHPKKRTRPLAAGKVKIPVAIVFLIIFIIVGFTIGFLLSKGFFIIILTYFSLNLGYSLGLKKIPILDIFIVASGFLFRTISGGFIAEVIISQWLVIMVFLLALFLALAKRRDDLLVKQASGNVTRKSVKGYNMDFVNFSLAMLSAIIVVSYLMYTIEEEVTQQFHSEHLYFTAIFVIAGIMRYLQITLVEEDSSSPTKVLYTDKFIIFTLLGWLLSFFMIIYLPTL